MSARTINTSLDGLTMAISGILDEYEAETISDLKSAITDVTKASTKQIKANARNIFKTHEENKGESYYNSWKAKYTDSNIGRTGTIYSTKPGLPHLLEFGHATRNGGRVEGRAHIEPVAELAEKMLLDYFN